jgi:uncharacterized membrane protein YhaH (DUF805 family)
MMPESIPFFIARPGETDTLFVIVAVALALAVLALGTLSLTIRSWPDQLAAGAPKWQLQLVAILGLLSLLTFNNLIWLAALVLAVVRFPDLMTPLKELTRTLQSNADVARQRADDAARRQDTQG